jgi:hypothetical protein
MPRTRRGGEYAMRLVTRILLLLLAAAALAACNELAHRLGSEPSAAVEPAAHHDAAHLALPPGASWETLFSANWR